MTWARQSIFAGALWLAFASGCGTRAAIPSDSIAISAGHEHYFLANGLEVVLEEDHRAPLVSVRVRYHAGAKDDPEGRAGLAHLLEHLTFAAGGHLGRDQLMKHWHDLGAIDADAATTLDATDYWVTLPAPALENALWIEAERMAFTAPNIADDVLAREKAVVIAEWRERIGNRAYGLVEPAVRESLFPANHPYHHLAIGVPEEVVATTTADVATFLHRNYVPDNATLIVTGDFESRAARAMIDHHFLGARPGDEQPTRLVVTPVQPARSRVRLEANVREPVLVVAWFGPPLGGEGWEAAKLALAEIGGAVVRRRGFVSSGSTDGGRLGSILELRIRGAATSTFDDLAAEVALATKTIGMPDVAGQQASAITETVFGFEDLTSRTGHIAEELDVYGGADYANEHIHTTRRLTSDAVREAAHSIFDPRRAAWVWVQPSPSAPPGGRIVP
jgi:predicted Zn-dependent peptidase